VCNYVALSDNELRIHKRMQHQAVGNPYNPVTSTGPITCNICGYTDNDARRYARHMALHATTYSPPKPQYPTFLTPTETLHSEGHERPSRPRTRRPSVPSDQDPYTPGRSGNPPEPPVNNGHWSPPSNSRRPSPERRATRTDSSSSPPPPRRTKPPPPSLNNIKLKYDPAGSWDTFRAQYQILKRQQGWTDHEASTALVLSLKGPALEHVINTYGDQPPAYDSLVEMLNSYHRGSTTMETERANLRKRERRPQEPLQDYVTDLKRLANKAYKATQQELKDEMIRQQFVDGWTRRTTWLTKIRRKSETYTIDQLLRRAIELEAEHDCSMAILKQEDDNLGQVTLVERITRKKAKACVAAPLHQSPSGNAQDLTDSSDEEPVRDTPRVTAKPLTNARIAAANSYQNPTVSTVTPLLTLTTPAQYQVPTEHTFDPKYSNNQEGSGQTSSEGRGRGNGRGRGRGKGQGEAFTPGETVEYKGKQIYRCYGCGGQGHARRQCPTFKENQFETKEEYHSIQHERLQTLNQEVLAGHVLVSGNSMGRGHP
jgi:hypothetical protein